MENPISSRLLSFQTFLGKEITQSPSAYMNWLRPVLIEANYGSLKCSYLIREEMTNPHAILHGGVTAGIMDDLIGATVFTMDLSDAFTTVSNYIDYFAPAKVGELIVAETSVIKRGRSIINLQCEIFLPVKKRLIARGYSNLLNVGKG